MRNVWTIARKELRSYFDHPTAYILVVVFLVINFFFYFRNAFLIGEASLRPMFDMLPWIFLFFVPAVTMSALAEERKRGTLEVVLSHPIAPHEFLLGKYVGNLLFLLIALAATIVAPITLLAGGTPDLGVLVAQYAGSILLAAAMCAAGLFASAITHNQITAFILGTATIFVLMLVGSEIVQIGLPDILADPLAHLGILPHFYNVTRGVIDLRDIVYFVSVAAAFLSLAYWLLLRERLNRRARLYRNLQLGTAVVLAIAIVANLFGRYIPGRLDLTAENLYTLSGGTKGILSDLDDLVTVTLYVSSELPAQVKLAQRDVEDVLRDFERYGGGDVRVVERHPDESEDARQEARSLGIRPVQFNVVRREELQVKQGWLGLAVQYADESETIPFVRDARNLEYELATRIWTLTRTETPKVAFVTGHGERSASDYAPFNRELRRTYEVSTIDLSDTTATIGPDVDALIVAGPRRAVDARSRRLLREYLAGDGRLLYLGDGANVNMRFLMASATPDSALDYLPDLGVRVNPDMVYDLRSNESITVPGEFINYVMAYPLWVRALPATEHAITRDINSVFMPWPSSLDTISAPDRQFTPLLETSEFAGTQSGRFQIRPDRDLSFDRENLKRRLIAVAIEGAVPATPSRVTRSDTVAIEMAQGEGTDQTPDTVVPVEREVATGPKRGRLVVVGDADFLTEQFAGNSPGNVLFATNAVSWLTQNEALLSIRAKTPTPRPLVFESESTQVIIKYLNLIGVPLAFVLFGAVRLWNRRRLTRRRYET